MSYGAAQRLQEQIDILTRDTSRTDIVLLSLLGEPAVPLLVKLLDAEENDSDGEKRKLLRGDDEEAVIRALGMIAHPSAAPALIKKFRVIEEPRYGDDKTIFRATANALRKIGTPEALDAIMSRLHELDVEHASASIQAFGHPGQAEILALLEQGKGPQLEAAIAIAGRLGMEDTVPALLQIVEAGLASDAAILAAGALAHHKKVPQAPLVAALAKAIAARKSNARRAESGDDDSPGKRQEFSDTLLAAIYHTQGVQAVAALLPLAVTEKGTRDEYWGGERESISDAIVSFGKPALKYLEGRAVEDYSGAVRALATKLANRIHEEDEGRKPDLPELGKRRSRIG